MPRKRFHLAVVAALLAFLAVYAAALGSQLAGATTLTADPEHPYSPAEMQQLQRWVDVAGGRVRTPAGAIKITHAQCPDGHSQSCTDTLGQVWLARLDRFDALHEVGHVDQGTDGPGVPVNGGWSEGWSLAKRGAVTDLLHMDGYPFWADVPSRRVISEVAADAYAMCSTRPGAERWWRSVHRHGRLWEESDTSTPYDFRAGPKRYHEICRVLRETT